MEIIISMAILSVGLVGAMRVFPMGLRASQRSEMRSRAAITAQRVLESLKLVSWDELEEGTVSREEDGFTITTRLTSAPVETLSDPARLKAVEVSVQWVEEGRTRQSSFITYVRRDDGSRL